MRECVVFVEEDDVGVRDELSNGLYHRECECQGAESRELE